MLEELERLSLAVGVVSRSDAQRVVDAVNHKLVSLLHAPVAKLYWREEAEEGTVLEPIAYVNNTRHKDPRLFPITKVASGVLSWTFNEAKPLWLSGLTQLPAESGFFAAKAHRPKVIKDWAERTKLRLSRAPNLQSVLSHRIVVNLLMTQVKRNRRLIAFSADKHHWLLEDQNHSHLHHNVRVRRRNIAYTKM